MKLCIAQCNAIIHKVEQYDPHKLKSKIQQANRTMGSIGTQRSATLLGH